MVVAHSDRCGSCKKLTHRFDESMKCEAVDLVGIVTGWGDGDMDPEEKKKLDDVAAKLGVGK